MNEEQPEVPWQPVPGLVQLVMAVYVPAQGWLTVRRSILYGGRHGEPPLIDLPVKEIEAILAPEIRTGIRAMKKRLGKP